MFNILFCALALLVASTELASACIMSEEYKQKYLLSEIWIKMASFLLMSS